MDYVVTGNDLPPGTFDASSGGAFIASSVSFFVGILLVSIPVIFFASFFISLLKSDSEKSLSVLKDTMRRAAIGFFTLIVMMALFTFINPRLLDFQWFSMGGGASTQGKTSTIVTPSTKTNTQSNGPSCTDPSVLISNQNNGRPICLNGGGAGCSNFCQFDTTVRNTVVKISQANNVDYRIMLALACRESTGIQTKIGKLATNGKEDCGLMQIHSGDFGKSKCSDVIINGKSIMDLETNITLGVQFFKNKLASVSKYSYNGITKESMAFAAYNCCANGDNPNSLSTDCNTRTGFPYDLPKWACPINPGTGDFNMCKVKNYACDVEYCSKQY